MGGVCSVTSFALLRCLCELFQHLAEVRAGLSTRRSFCKCSVSAGVGLFAQQSGRRLYSRFVFITQDIFLELLSFDCRHRLKEGLYPFHFRFNWLLVCGAWAVSGVVSFLLAFETRSLCVYHVLSG